MWCPTPTGVACPRSSHRTTADTALTAALPSRPTPVLHGLLDAGPGHLHPGSLSVRSLPCPAPSLDGRLSAGFGQRRLRAGAVSPRPLCYAACSRRVRPERSLLRTSRFTGPGDRVLPWPGVTVSAEGRRWPASGRLAALCLVTDPLGSSPLHLDVLGRFSGLAGPGLTTVLPLQVSACSDITTAG